MAKSSVNMDLTGDEKNLVRALTRSEKKVDELKRKLLEMGRAGRKAGKDTTGAFAQAGINQIARYAAGIISVTALIGGASSALREFQQLQQKAATGIRTREGALLFFKQLAGGSVEEFQRLRATSAEITGAGIMPAIADIITANALSLGFTHEQVRKLTPAFREVAPAEDITKFFEASAGLRLMFGAGAAGGTPRSRINALIAGARESKVKTEVLAPEVLAVGANIARLGGTSEEAIAAVAAASGGAATVSEASTAVNRFASVLQRDPRFKGVTFTEALDRFRGLGDEEREEVIGQNEKAIVGARLLLQALPLYRGILAQVQEAVANTGTALGELTQAQRLTGEVPVLGQLQRTVRAEAVQAREEQREFATTQLAREEQKAIIRTLDVEHGVGPFPRFLGETYIRLLELFDAPPSAFAAISSGLRVPRGPLNAMGAPFTFEGVAPNVVSPEVFSAIGGDAGDKLDRAAGRIEKVFLAPGFPSFLAPPPRTATLAPVNVEPQ